MKSFSYVNPTQIVFGPDTVNQIGSLLQPYNVKKVLLVYGGGSIKKTGLYDNVIGMLHNLGINVYELPGVEPNPRLGTVHKGIATCREHDVDFILAVGGGSVIDAAKAVALGVPYEGDVWDFFTRKASPKAGLPLGTILTLSATGSEMNGNTVVSSLETQQKLGAGSIHAYPKFSILDPTLTFTVPANQTAYGIVDIMSHVFEQYFSQTLDTPLQERLCESVLQTVIDNGLKAIEKPDDYAARANLMLCGTFALNGNLISVGMQNDWASHGIEHELSAIYDIAHGAGLAIIFPNWMRYVYASRIDRFVQFAVRVWGIDPSGKTDEELALEGIEATSDFFRSLGAPLTLSELGIDEEHFGLMASKAVQFYGYVGAFRKLKAEDIEEIYRMSL
jgi:alcohol dehydrogenase